MRSDLRFEIQDARTLATYVCNAEFYATTTHHTLHTTQLPYHITSQHIIHSLTSPNANNPIPAALGQIAILDPDPLDNRRTLDRTILIQVCPRPAVPVVAIGLIVHFGDVFSCGRYDASVVEHHACDGVVVGVGVVDGSGSEIPDLGVC